MQRGDIYYLKLPEQLGSIQAGIRPVIVIQNDTGNTFSTTTIVCSITSARKKKLPTHLAILNIGGLRKHSTVLCEQMFTVNKSDLIQHIGTVDDKDTIKQLDKCIQLSIGI